MISSTFFNIFRKGSKTFFYSSLFFPAEIRDEVFTFYSFVRTADDFVDTIPQQRKDFLSFKRQLLSTLGNKTTSNPIISSFVQLSKKYSFKQSWIKSFMQAMESDLKPKKEITEKQLNSYIHGSAEVIGLMLAHIFKLEKKSYPAAKKMGKAMQLINFIRDIDEDNTLGRIYFTKTSLRQFGLKDLKHKTTLANAEGFKKFIHFQIEKYHQINNQGKKGFKYLPVELLIPVKTATNMYEWTAQQIYNDPFIIYRTKVKPSVSQILYKLGRNSLPL